MEVCVDNVQSALNAERGGAARIELCSALSEGGLTPSTGLIQKVKALLCIPIHVMIRPRKGDFVYSDNELDIMKTDIINAKNCGVEGVVFGVLNTDGTVDKIKCRELIKLSLPLSCTFHRAFDMTSDPDRSLEDIVELNFERILTSGQSKSAEIGIPLLTELQELAGNRIIIMAGAGINPKNIYKILSSTGIKEYHASARANINSEMKFQNLKCTTGVDNNEFTHYLTDLNLVKEIITEAKKAL